MINGDSNGKHENNMKRTRPLGVLIVKFWLLLRTNAASLGLDTQPGILLSTSLHTTSQQDRQTSRHGLLSLCFYHQAIYLQVNEKQPQKAFQPVVHFQPKTN